MKNVLDRHCALLLLLLSSAAAVSAAPAAYPMPHPPTLGASSSSDPNVPAYDAAVSHFNRVTQEYAAAQASNKPADWATADADGRQNVNEIIDLIAALGKERGTGKDLNTMNNSLRQMRDYLFSLEHDDAYDAVVKGFGAVTEKYQASKDAAALAANTENAAAIHALLQKPRYQNNETLYSMLGNLSLLRDAPDQAIPDLETAVRLNPNDLGARYNLAYELQQVQPPRYADAIQQYQAVLDALGNNPASGPATSTPATPTVNGPKLTVDSVRADLVTAQVREGDTLFKSGDTPGAAQVLDQAAQADPKNATNLLNAGQLNFLAGQYDKAIKDLSAAVGTDVSNPLNATDAYNAHFTLAEAYAATKDTNSAIKAYQSASQDQPDNPKPLYNAGVLQQQAALNADAIASYRAANAAAGKVDPKTQTQIQVALASLLLQSGAPSDLTEAAQLAKNASSLPEDQAAPVYAALGQGYLALGGTYARQADTYASQSPSNNDASVHALLLYERAAGVLGQAAVNLPDVPDNAKTLASVQIRRGLIENQRGVIYERLKQPKKAQEAFLSALKLDPTLAAARNNLGVTYEQLDHKPAEARAAYQTAHRLDPALSEASYNLSRPLGPAPEDEDAYSLNESGTAYFTLKRYAKALAAFQRAARVDADSAQIQNNVGAAYLALGNRTAARAAFRKALALDPNLEAARQNLGDSKGRPRLVTYQRRARP